MILRPRGVMRSPEFERIKALPRRDWQKEADDDFIFQTTQYFKRPHGSMVLWPMQAASLAEAHDARGLVLSAGVGTGKTLSSVLLPVVLESRRPILFVPAQLRDKTRYDIPRLNKHWRLHDDLQVFSYDDLSRESGLELLQKISPDLIVADEAHRLAYPNAARTRRFLRYFGENPDTLFVCMSGTISRRSIMDYWHLVKLALKGAAPLPQTRWEAMDWSDALDINPRNGLLPGVLLELCEPGETARQGYQRRLSQTRGVIVTQKTSCPVPIIINRLTPKMAPVVAQKLKLLYDTWETPNGEQCTEALEVWRHARELSMGFFYRWVWPNDTPNLDWLAARRAWRTFVRHIIRYNRRKLDTEMQVANACLAGELPRADYDAWVAIRDVCKPMTEPVWIDDSLVQYVATRARKHKCIVWVEHDAFGRRLSAVSGLPYHGAGSSQAAILSHRAGSVILSAHSHREGKNLQEPWSRNLVVSAPPSGAAWDQMLGRTHREGQPADEVVCDVCLHTRALQEGFANAIADAHFLQETLGQEQKLLYADRTFSPTVF